MKKFLILTFLIYGHYLLAQIFHSTAINDSGKIYDLSSTGSEILVATDSGIWFVNRFSQQQILHDTAHGLPHLPVYHLHKAANGSVSAATAHQAFADYNGQLQSWSKVHLNAIQSFSHFTYVFEESNGNRILGTDSGLVFKQQAGASIITEQAQYRNQIQLGNITSIHRSSNGVLAVLSTNGILLDIGGFLVPVTSSSALPSDSVLCGEMHQDVSYDGTVAGLYIADFSQGAPPAVSTFNMVNCPLPSNRIQALAIHRDTLFIGTDRGLALYAIHQNNWTIYNASNSNLPAEDISHIAIDEAGGVWLTTAGNHLVTFAQGISLPEKHPLSASPTLYPNPVEHTLNIKGNKSITEKMRVEIYNPSGERLGQLNAKDSSPALDLSDLKPGVYFALIKQGTALSMLKFLKN